MNVRRLAELAARCDPAGKSPDELEPLTWAERTELARLLGQLHAMFVEAMSRAAKPANRPAKDIERKFWAVLEMVLDIARDVPPEAAREAAKRNWNFTTREMKEAVSKHRQQAEDMAASSTDPASLAVVVKMQRDKK